MFQTMTSQSMNYVIRTLAALLLLSGLSTSAHAQKVTPGTVDVVPLVAAANTARRISIAGMWPNSCPPGGATVVSETTTSPRTLLIRLDEVLTLIACAQVLTPFSVGLDYTPTTPGVLHISVLQASGLMATSGMLGVTDGSSANANLSGTWFDAPSVGSLFMITHSVLQPDTMVGSWNLFARDGQPRWYFFHSSRRTKVPYVYEAQTYEYQSAPNPDCPISACPVPGFTGKQIGSLRVTALTSRELIVEHWLKGFPSDVLVQRSAMMRVDL